MRNRILVAALAALVGCGGNDVTCGDGTTEVNGVCQASGGSNAGDTCGSGTMLMGTMCVPSGNQAGAPTIAQIVPPSAGIFGLVQFGIEGTGFAGDNVTDLHVFFGDTSNPNCEASIGPASPTVIVGAVPFFCDFNVDVSVITNLGMATTPFHYNAIFAADGDGGAQFGGPTFGGNVYLIDPTLGFSFDLGALQDTNGNGYGIDGMTFDTTGENMFAVTTGDSPADLAAAGSDATSIPSTLISFDVTNGTVTVLGPVVDATTGANYIVTDIKLSNGTLYGWAADFTNQLQGLVAIDTATGKATILGGALADFNENQPFTTAGLAFDATNTLNVAANGAGSDDLVGATGELDTANLTTGALTASATTLDWFVGSPINAMDFDGTSMYAVLDDGFNGLNSPIATGGETLAIIDPTAANGEVVVPQFEMPAQVGFTSAVDAIAVPPVSTTLSFRGKRDLPRDKWTKLAAAHAGSKLAHR